MTNTDDNAKYCGITDTLDVGVLEINSWENCEHLGAHYIGTQNESKLDF